MRPIGKRPNSVLLHAVGLAKALPLSRKETTVVKIHCTADARDTLAQFQSIEALAEWLRAVVREWASMDARAESVAFAGSSWSNVGQDPDPIAETLFDVIADQVGDTSNQQIMLAGIDRMEQMAKAQQGGQP